MENLDQSRERDRSADFDWKNAQQAKLNEVNKGDLVDFLGKIRVNAKRTNESKRGKPTISCLINQKQYQLALCQKLIQLDIYITD